MIIIGHTNWQNVRSREATLQFSNKHQIALSDSQAVKVDYRIYYTER